jgi:hypothetical protein
MVVMSRIEMQPADGEEPLEVSERLVTACSLRHHKPVEDLVAGLVAASACAVWLPHETNREASFSVYKTNNPARRNQPFLLIFRTIRFVTARRSPPW